MRVIVNKFAKKCVSCGIQVDVGKGFAYNNNGWKTVCNSTACHQRMGVKPPQMGEQVIERTISEHGIIHMPFDRDALPLIKSLPGAKWNPDDKVWSCSVDADSLPRVIEICEKLEMKIPDLLRQRAAEGTVESRAAKSRAESFESPTGKRLYDYQKEGVIFLSQHKAALLADDMGLGKTVQVLAAVPDDAAVLVICPASVKYNWEKEFNEWRPEFKTRVFNPKDKVFDVPGPGEVYITSFNLLPDYLAQAPSQDKKRFIPNPNMPPGMLAKLQNIHLVVDELQNCKNFKAKRSKLVKGIAVNAKVRWGLSGTPLDNRPGDLFGALSAIHTYPLGSFSRFLELFDGYRDRWGSIHWGMPSPEVPERLKKVMIRRLKKDVLKDLPEKVHQTIVVNGVDKRLNSILDTMLVRMCVKQGLIVEYVPLTKAEMKKAGKTAAPFRKKRFSEWKFTKEVVAAYRDVAHDHADLLEQDGDSLPSIEEMSEIRSLLAASRIPAVIEMVEEYEDMNEPVVVASDHVSVGNALGEREGWAVINGSVSPEKRQQIVEAFQAGELKGVALTIIAGGVGLTLTRASHMIFADRNWKASWNIQCEDRIHRIGQKNNCHYKVMVSNHPLDRHISALLEQKIAWARAALDGGLDYKAPEEKVQTPETPELRHETLEELEARIAANEEKNKRKKKERNRKFYKDKVANILERERGKAQLSEPELTPERCEMIRDALDYMCSRCDGAMTKDYQGFNKPDSAIGHWLVKTGLDDENSLRCAERIMSRYYRQLGGLYPGIWGR